MWGILLRRRAHPCTCIHHFHTTCHTGAYLHIRPHHWVRLSKSMMRGPPSPEFSGFLRNKKKKNGPSLSGMVLSYLTRPTHT
jgi:hypothetical protein